MTDMAALLLAPPSHMSWYFGHGYVGGAYKCVVTGPGDLLIEEAGEHLAFVACKAFLRARASA
jgi:hypothetical protein